MQITRIYPFSKYFYHYWYYGKAHHLLQTEFCLILSWWASQKFSYQEKDEIQIKESIKELGHGCSQKKSQGRLGTEYPVLSVLLSILPHNKIHISWQKVIVPSVIRSASNRVQNFVGKETWWYCISPLAFNPLQHNPEFKQPWEETTFENNVEKGENAVDHFLLFPQYFLPFPKQNLIFDPCLICHLQMLSIWTSLKFCRLLES